MERSRGNSLTDYGVEWLETFRRLVIENERECAEAVAIVNSTLYGVAFCETAGTLIPYGTKLFTFPPAAQVSEWQPIETAPKDGTRVILGNKYGVWMGEFCDTYQSGYKPQNPWQSVLLNHDYISKQRSYFPTHWMPLPAEPEVKQ